MNLIDHHHGAHRMLVELHTPKSINEDDFHRHIFILHSRHDVMTSLMARNPPALSRDWYMEAENVTSQEAARHPDDISVKILAWGGRNRRFAMDMACLVAKMSQGLLSENEFRTERISLGETVARLKQYTTSMEDSRHLINSFPHQKPLGPEDVVDPYVPGVIHGGPLFEVNLCMAEFYAGVLMYEYQIGMMQQQLDFADLQKQALHICQMIETMDRLPDKPVELPLLVQSPSGMASLLMPLDEAHTAWCRKMLARIELQG